MRTWYLVSRRPRPAAHDRPAVPAVAHSRLPSTAAPDPPR
jgi:hypothetical protein